MSLVQRRLRGLRSDPRISRLIVEGKSTGKHLGKGSYGFVEEVNGARIRIILLVYNMYVVRIVVVSCDYLESMI